VQHANAIDSDAQAFLDSPGVARKIVEFKRKETIFSQGDACGSVTYIQRGGIKLSVVSKTGKEAVVAILGRVILLARGAWPGSRYAWPRPRP
jgi:CRP/FNR family cyclic AMP-dependent transcriptional regulator